MPNTVLGGLKPLSILVFFVTYALFSIAGFLFPVNRVWYDTLSKPSWTPPGYVIGIVWAVLFGLISLSLAALYQAGALTSRNWPLIALIAVNWFFNQGFSYVQFVRNDLLLATVDAGLVALTALGLVVFAARFSTVAFLALIPYTLWSSFATFLSWKIYSLNL